MDSERPWLVPTTTQRPVRREAILAPFWGDCIRSGEVVGGPRNQGTDIGFAEKRKANRFAMIGGA